jgi:nanoRNase/pAp phosphatase (c-di-AMP/oligoRNAs hydrolase)
MMPVPGGEVLLKMKLSTTDRLPDFFKQFSGSDQVLVIISADPDAIACALAVSRLLAVRAAGITISNINQIDRPDNLAMVRLLRVPLVPFASVQIEQFAKLVMVDSQPNHNERMAALRPQVIIDHHPDTGYRAPYTDIRPSYGATATILTEYLRAARIVPSQNLATALYHAIKTDTDDFKRQTLNEDLQAFQYLFRRTNIQLARRIAQADLRFDYLKYFRTALQFMRLRKGRVFVHLGTVANPDVCVVIADFFMRIHTVTWSIISGIYDRKLVIIFRNDGARKNAGRVAQEAFGYFGSAGGHKSAARAEINLAESKEPGIDFKDPRKVLNWIITRTEKRTRRKAAAPKTDVEGRPASGNVLGGHS